MARMNFRSRVSWGPILCGTFMTMGVGLMFVLFGNAIGLSAANLVSDTSGTGIKVISWIYNMVTLLASFYVGGLTTARIAEVESTGPAALYGLTTWAVSGVLISAFGLLISDRFLTLVSGEGLNAANWFLALVSIFGGAFSALGGQNGSMGVTLRTVSTEKEIEEHEEIDRMAM